jgi:hypothetical protein
MKIKSKWLNNIKLKDKGKISWLLRWNKYLIKFNGINLYRNNNLSIIIIDK